MNSQLQALFSEVQDPAAMRALAPLLALSAGVLLCLLLDIVDGLQRLRPLAVVGSLLAAGWFQFQILNGPAAAPTVLGDTFAVGPSSAAWGLLIVCAALVAWLASVGYYERDHTPFKGEHDALLLSSAAGMTLMSAANDLLVFFVGLELLSIPLYALAAFRRSRSASVEAGVKYFLLGAFASALFLYGAALLYADGGHISLTELRARGAGGALALIGSALLAASLFFKVSVFPFHLWVPDVYQGSPTPVAALMATGTKAAGFAFLFNACFLLPPQAAGLVAVIALITLALGNLGALVQDDLKRMLAYSGVAHAGTLLLAIAGALHGYPGRGSLGPDKLGLADPAWSDALQASLFYMAAYVFTAGGAFAILARLEAEGEHATRLDSLRGLHRRSPWLAAALALFMFSLGGIPGAGGFWGKWLVFRVLVRADMLPAALFGILLSVVALGYYLRVIVALYMQPDDERARSTCSPSPAALLATGVCAAAVLLTGLAPGLILSRLG